ncbi:MAG: TrkH family potassium uptake protein [Clostridia bacterium]|nr:TrkH family potassium uptake protein [Clostridia bacterium]
MNRKMVLFTTGELLLLEAALLLLPTAVSVLYRESTTPYFLITVAIALCIGGAMCLLFRPQSRVIYAKEGFIITTLSWLSLSAIGALPFYLSGEIPSYTDAFFETVSGFTTTGASILANVEALSRSLLFWRSFTHWIGGMGVLVLMMAIIPPSEGSSGRSIHIMRAEMPGPVVGKLVPRVRETAKILYLIYIIMTLTQFILLALGGMPVFDSLLHAFGTAGTGGFGIKVDSFAGYSPYLQWITTVFMLLFGINFNIYYLLLVRSFRSALRSTELWCYLGITAVSVSLITVNILPLCTGIGDALRHAAFQVASIITTTGYATVDFDLWPQLSRAILFLLMFVGACAGSTGGGMKVSRLIILARSAKQSIYRMLHPRSVSVVRFEGKPVEHTTLDGLATYMTLYFLSIAIGFLILSLEPFDFETNLSAIVSCFNNIGPGLGAVGPSMNYAAYSQPAKLVLAAAMLFGRLEILPILIAISPSTWTKK